MDLIEAIKNRRSIRHYRPDPVSQEQLNIVLEAARWAPSWSNTQTWRFIVIRDRETKKRLTETFMSSRGPGQNAATQGFMEADLAIMVCAQTGRAGFYPAGEKKGQFCTEKGPWWYLFDAGLAVQNMALAAYSLGLGTINIGNFSDTEVRQIMELPPELAIVDFVALGWPNENPAPRPRLPLEQIVFEGKYRAET